MLVKIEREFAFELLMDSEQSDKVYFKGAKSYHRANNYNWCFAKGVQNAMNFSEETFYREIEEV